MDESHPYPISVQARLEEPLSRWLWLVKWLLALPHYLVLIGLGLAYVVSTAISWIAILATGRYPRPLFDFNVGVLRWGWRVGYYAYSALGTDRYPPFTLADIPDYPARLRVEYPERPSRLVALFQWWLLAIPHYVIVGIFMGAGPSSQTRDGENVVVTQAYPGLLSVLVLVAAVLVAATGRYPEQLWRLVVGINRWSLRVTAYASLMTDRYPPFRLDQGGTEPDAGTPVAAPDARPWTPYPAGPTPSG